MTKVLPKEFSALQRFVDYWVVDDSEQRIRCRTETSMDTITEFYDAALPFSKKGLEYLDQFDLNDMPDEAVTLFKLMLSLTHASIAVELHRQPRVPFSNSPTGIKLLRGAPPYG